MLFKKNDSANLVSKSTKCWKNRSQKTKEAQNVVFNLKGRIPLLFYSVKHIHGQFKTYLKLKTGFFVFKQIAKSIPTVQWEKPCRDILLNPFCFVSYRFLNLYDTISFDMLCFHCSVWRSDRWHIHTWAQHAIFTSSLTSAPPRSKSVYCVFETCIKSEKCY
jgi:hypothetical protein